MANIEDENDPAGARPHDGEASRKRESRGYEILYSPEARDHLAGLTARRRAIVVDTVERRLGVQPTVT